MLVINWYYCVCIRMMKSVCWCVVIILISNCCSVIMKNRMKMWCVFWCRICRIKFCWWRCWSRLSCVNKLLCWWLLFVKFCVILWVCWKRCNEKFCCWCWWKNLNRYCRYVWFLCRLVVMILLLLLMVYRNCGM